MTFLYIRPETLFDRNFGQNPVHSPSRISLKQIKSFLLHIRFVITIFVPSGCLLFLQALLQDYHLLFRQVKSSSKELPWRKPTPVIGYDSIVGRTLFGLDFLSVTIDEAHEFRNVGAKHSAALAIVERAKVRLIMTATPLQTSTKVRSQYFNSLQNMTSVQDLASMGRIVGIEHFLSRIGLDEERADMASLRRAKASLGDDYDPLNPETTGDDPIREAQALVSLRIQGQFEQRVLRRTAESKNWLGEKLINLPELHEHIVLLTLQPWEREVHLQLAERMREE